MSITQRCMADPLRHSRRFVRNRPPARGGSPVSTPRVAYVPCASTARQTLSDRRKRSLNVPSTRPRQPGDRLPRDAPRKRRLVPSGRRSFPSTTFPHGQAVRTRRVSVSARQRRARQREAGMHHGRWYFAGASSQEHRSSTTDLSAVRQPHASQRRPPSTVRV